MYSDLRGIPDQRAVLRDYLLVSIHERAYEMVRHTVAMPTEGILTAGGGASYRLEALFWFSVCIANGNAEG